MKRRDFLACSAGAAAACLGLPAGAVELGPVTHLPIPRFVSLRGHKGYARRGPSLTQRIDWVFTREGMPLRITGEFDHWRRVEDKDGLGGWMHYTLISGVRTVIVTKPMVILRALPDNKAPITAKAEQNVIARLHAARHDWCRISADGDGGWVEKTAVWGVGKTETFG
ncbi:SH3 domain-containing protein [Solirhodobacter olei]|uniref:SH3 domain-containing protein n=1 Tax=Solirhodobacter olei TaxID=2493082 RepID=UPI001F4E5705|nr:SH3 domain-containing protein [Solirhodobacter olei]